MDQTSGVRFVANLPKTMKALQYAKPEEFAVIEMPLPRIGAEDVLIKVAACGVCGTDLHLHKGEFLATFPLTPGHEAVGTIVGIGDQVTWHRLGERVAVDPLQSCQDCYQCIRGKDLMCEKITGFGTTVAGGFAEYCKAPGRQVHSIGDLPFLDGCLVEPGSCATHGIERMLIRVGSRALLFGCGPTGILLAQLLRINGVAHLTIASKGGPKLDLARKLQIADSYACISDDQPQVEMQQLAAEHPHGFDLVIEATGAPSVLQQSINFVTKGGTLVVYGVYDEDAIVSWSPSRIWTHEITILASFCGRFQFPTILQYLKYGKLITSGIVDRTFRIEEWDKCLEVLRDQSTVKAAIVFD